MGVPADRAAELRSELEPILALTDPAARRADDIVYAAMREADRRRQLAIEQERSMLEEARSQAKSTRARAEAEAVESRRHESEEIDESARREAKRIDHLGGVRAPQLADELVHRLLASLAQVDRS